LPTCRLHRARRGCRHAGAAHALARFGKADLTRVEPHGTVEALSPFLPPTSAGPSALTTVTATLHAIGKALEDCRNAGVSPDSDPAVALLTRHMATVSSNQADAEVLRAACHRRLEELQRFPTLLALAIRGVEYDVGAKNRFHEDGRAAMLQLAIALDLDPETYTVCNFEGTPDQSGNILLAAADVAVMVQIGGRHEGREVSYRAVSEGLQQPNRFTSVRDLLKPDRFADRLCRELGLKRAATPANLRIPLPA
jgi:hypothetical protein